MNSQLNPGTAAQTPGVKPVAGLPEARQGPDVATSDATRGDSGSDPELFQGTWRTIAMVIDGRRIPPAALEHRRMIAIDDKYVIVDSDRTLRRGGFRIDPATTPKQIDALPADGPHAGMVIKGIYELATDLGRLCYASPDQPRPAEFTSPPGSRRWMCIFQKDTLAMMVARSPVIAVPEVDPACSGVSATLVYHRKFPELCGKGGTPYEAALDLLRQLTGETGTTPDRWHRAALEEVIADVQAFLHIGVL